MCIDCALPKDADFSDNDTPIALAPDETKLEPPRQYKVVLMNDDYTPMEFVIDLLELFFAMNRGKATRIMLEIHTQGRGICGIYPYDIAETKVAQVNTFAREHQHPLLCTLEAA